jgi:transketolase
MSFETAVKTIQFLAADGVQRAGCGHPGTPMALAGITTELFSNTLRYNPKDPTWPNRDRFVLSCGHASMLLYSVLHLAGYAVSKEDLMNFRQLNSKTPGHPEFGDTEGVETTTGPLGQGFGNAVGMALASKIQGARCGEDLINYRVFALASDGDLMEGVASEAASLAGHLGLGNLVVIYDDNNITIDGKAEVSFSEDVAQRFAAYGWSTARCDGHNPEQVRAAINAAVAETDKPTLIIAKTHIGIGCPTKQDTSAAHGAALGRDEINGAKRNAGWPEEEFVVPSEAHTPFAARVEAVKPEYDAWQTRVGGLSSEQKQQFSQFTAAQAPKDLLEQLVAAADTKTDATRASGSRILQAAARLMPGIISGSADLNASTKTDIKDGGHIVAGKYDARNIHFGIREHAMGAMASGMALSGLIPVTSTFMIFSDYMRPSIRLASMMRQRSIFVFTHDSFYVGEDGPTHQPIEQVASLRFIPNLHVFRPADSMECAAAWTHALSRKDGPTAIALTRQNVPALKRGAGFDPKQMLLGAYVVQDVKDPSLVLVATGSEVAPALEAATLLDQQGHRTRVVSMPCVELFRHQSEDVQRQILGAKAKRVSIEAGVTGGWGAIVGLDGLSIGLDRFGASAPAEQLQEQFGFTGKALAERISQEL